jgi:hypothetical protein
MTHLFRCEPRIQILFCEDRQKWPDLPEFFHIPDPGCIPPLGKRIRTVAEISDLRKQPFAYLSTGQSALQRTMPAQFSEDRAGLVT